MIHLMIALQVAAADPASLEAKLQEIRAYVPISEQLATSGLMTYDQIEDLANAGFDLIINLAPTVAERNGREGDVVTEHAMSYVQIPVEWENPRQEDLDRFFEVMDENQGRKVLVHCFANMRASAFVYLYRTLRRDESPTIARLELEEIWDPASLEQWEMLVREAEARYGRNR